MTLLHDSPAAVLRVSVVALSTALQHSLGVLSDALDLPLPVNNPNNSERRHSQPLERKL